MHLDMTSFDNLDPATTRAWKLGTHHVRSRHVFALGTFHLEDWHLYFLVIAHESTAAQLPLVKIYMTPIAQSGRGERGPNPLHHAATQLCQL
jgi:hypothetical protein